VSKYFGTDGIRGKAEMFTTDFIKALVIGLLEYDKSRERDELKVLVGGDTRESTEWIIRDLETVLETLGVEHGNVGVLPTPGINLAFYDMGFDYAIDVTASHNTSEDNGIKIFERGEKGGEKLKEAGKQAIEEALNEGRAFELVATELREDLHDDALERYMEHLREYVRKPLTRKAGGTDVKIDLSGMKIGVDCANGAMSVIGDKLFTEMGAEVTLINNDASYGTLINRSAGCLHIEQMQKLVKDRGLDFGVAFDGDGDRCLMVDHTGEVVDGDQVMAILGNYLQVKSMVTTVMCNQGLMEWGKRRGVKLWITDVGDQYVAEKMRQEKIELGGEQSGHIILPGEAMGDGMLTALMVMRIVAEKKQSLRKLAGTMQRFPQVMVNMPATKAEKLALTQDEAVKALIEEYHAKLDSMGGRMLVRPSGTEELIRITMWGQDEGEIMAQAKELERKLKNPRKG